MALDTKSKSITLLQPHEWYGKLHQEMFIAFLSKSANLLVSLINLNQPLYKMEDSSTYPKF